MGAIQDDDECSYEKDLTEKFVEQTRLNKDPVHYGRALAMQGETLGRLGLFERALESLDRINTIYDIETQHESICKSYGSLIFSSTIVLSASAMIYPPILLSNERPT